MKNKDEKRKEVGVYENTENVKTCATIAKRMTDKKPIGKLECVESGMIVKKSDIRNEVEARILRREKKAVYCV